MAGNQYPHNGDETAKRLAAHHAAEAKRLRTIAIYSAITAAGVVVCATILGRPILAAIGTLIVANHLILPLIFLAVCASALYGLYAGSRAVIRKVVNKHNYVNKNRRGHRRFPFNLWLN